MHAQIHGLQAGLYIAARAAELTINNTVPSTEHTNPAHSNCKVCFAWILVQSRR